MLKLYHYGPTSVPALSTPESRAKKPPTEYVQGLLFLTVNLEGKIEILRKLGMKRYMDTDAVYRRDLSLLEPDVHKHIVRMSLIKSEYERQWIKENPKASKEDKHTHLKEEGLVHLSYKSFIKPKGRLKEELDKIEDIFNAVLSGRRSIENKKSLSPGIPWINVTVSRPIPVKSKKIAGSPVMSQEEKPIYLDF
jgi:hypothetical protein